MVSLVILDHLSSPPRSPRLGGESSEARGSRGGGACNSSRSGRKSNHPRGPGSGGTLPQSSGAQRDAGRVGVQLGAVGGVVEEQLARRRTLQRDEVRHRRPVLHRRPLDPRQRRPRDHRRRVMFRLLQQPLGHQSPEHALHRQHRSKCPREQVGEPHACLEVGCILRNFACASLPAEAGKPAGRHASSRHSP